MSYQGNSRVLFAVAIAFIILLSTSPVMANVYSDRDSVNQKLTEQRAALGQKRAEVSTLQSQMRALDQSIAALNNRIAVNSSQINKVSAEIATQESLLVVKKEQRNEMIRTAYRQGKTSPLEMLIGSGSLSAYFSKAQYLDDAEQKVTETAEQISQIKAGLAVQKTELEASRVELNGNRQAVNSERAKQSELLALTKGEESAFQALVEQTKAQKAKIDSQIAEISRLAALEKAKQQSGGSSASASGSVKRGQMIGREGTTGNSTGCHLHFTVYQNGSEVNPSPLIAAGTIGKPSSYSTSNITQYYGPAGWSNPWYSFHNGLDISVGCGTPIYAVADGDIVKNVTNDGSGYGHYIVINHNNGMLSLYAHMQ